MSKFWSGALSSSSSSRSSSSSSSSSSGVSSDAQERVIKSPRSSVSSVEVEGKDIDEVRQSFLKKETEGKSKPKPATKEQPLKPEGEEDKSSESDSGEFVDRDNDDDGPWQRQAKPLFDPKIDVTPMVVLGKLLEVVSGKALKNVERKRMLRDLDELYGIAKDKKMNIAILTKIKLSIIDSMFETMGSADITQWKNVEKIMNEVDTLVTTLLDNIDALKLTSATDEESELLLKEGEESGIEAEATTQPYIVHGSVVNLMRRLESDYGNIISKATTYDTDYQAKLDKESFLLELIEKCLHYVKLSSELAITGDEVALHMMELAHRYYKYTPDDKDAQERVKKLAKAVFSPRHSKQEAQRVYLYLAYHHAIHGRHDEAKALILSSRIQVYIDHSDLDTISLYHRVICQIGTALFQAGHIEKAHETLSELASVRHTGLLMAQKGRNVMLTEEEEEKLLRVRMIPYHMRVDYEFAELGFLICSMLLEMSPLVASEFEQQKPRVSRAFYQALIGVEKAFTLATIQEASFPRECVSAATHALVQADWKMCCELLFNAVRMEKRVWGQCRDADKLKETIEKRIKEEALKIYLYSYTPLYKNMSVQLLSERFKMSEPEVAAVVNKMIFRDGAMGIWIDAQMEYVYSERHYPTQEEYATIKATSKLGKLLQMATNATKAI